MELVMVGSAVVDDTLGLIEGDGIMLMTPAPAQCDFSFLLKTRVKKSYYTCMAFADLSISDLGKNCNNTTQYSTYLWKEHENARNIEEPCWELPKINNLSHIGTDGATLCKRKQTQREFRKENDQSNNFDDDNHNDNEMVEIITMCYVLGYAHNSINFIFSFLTTKSIYKFIYKKVRAFGLTSGRINSCFLHLPKEHVPRVFNKANVVKEHQGRLDLQNWHQPSACSNLGLKCKEEKDGRISLQWVYGALQWIGKFINEWPKFYLKI
eukprot:bmy_12261T0